MKKILIIGGYGAVGSIICEKLAQDYPKTVIAAGRSPEKARQLAEKLNQSIIPKQLDLANLSDTDIPEDVGLVIMCIDQTDTRFVEMCINKGINYIDITANQQLIEKIEQLDHKAKENNVSIVLSVGLAPGITNLLAQHAINTLPDGEWLNLFILLGLGEKHGEAAYRWTFDNLHTEYSIQINGKESKLKSFTSPASTQLLGKRTFYLFNFSDQHSLIKRTKLKNVKTRMAFDSAFLTRIMAFARKTGLTRIFGNEKVQAALIPLFRLALMGDDIYGAKVVIGNRKGETKEYSFTGKGEGKITALVAALTARRMLKTQAHFGVLHLNEIINDIPEFLNTLQNADGSVK